MGDEIRDGESITAFNIRRIVNDVIDRVAERVLLEKVIVTDAPISEDVAYNLAIDHAVEAILGMKQ